MGYFRGFLNPRIFIPQLIFCAMSYTRHKVHAFKPQTSPFELSHENLDTTNITY